MAIIYFLKIAVRVCRLRKLSSLLCWIAYLVFITCPALSSLDNQGSPGTSQLPPSHLRTLTLASLPIFRLFSPRATLVPLVPCPLAAIDLLRKQSLLSTSLVSFEPPSAIAYFVTDCYGHQLLLFPSTHSAIVLLQKQPLPSPSLLSSSLSCASNLTSSSLSYSSFFYPSNLASSLTLFLFALLRKPSLPSHSQTVLPLPSL